ncbi:MAG: DUF433 domain-containing protein [Acidobacteria bacterium]|nr:DUF433 domain-containing protein [Acidobacteriota bacterium]
MPFNEIDWSACPLVEVDPDRVGGRPVLKDTRLPVDDVLANHRYGVPASEIAEQFRVPVEAVEALIIYAERYSAVARSL